MVCRALQAKNYVVWSAGSAEEAMILIEGRISEIDLVFSDIVLPGLNGWEFVEQLRQKSPGIKVLFTSGYAGEVDLRDKMRQQPESFLAKPFGLEDLMQKLQKVFGSNSLS